MATPTTDYEQQRNARVGENQKRMQALGLLDLSRSLSSTPQQDNQRARKKPRVSADVPLKPPLDNTTRRRSSRLLGTTLPCYTEVKTVKEIDVAAADSRQIQPEIYTEEHEKLLGSCLQEWELFKDGFTEDGTRIYDSARGKTCHQCRQKTLGLRTSCSKCSSLRGQFCGDCLFMRYGENVIEANNNKEWECPGCRGICNCSFCRLKKGWAPTGSMYRLALKLNYKSVAHYLVMTRRGSTDVKQERKEEHEIILDEEGLNQELQSSEGLDESTGVRSICEEVTIRKASGHFAPGSSFVGKGYVRRKKEMMSQEGGACVQKGLESIGLYEHIQQTKQFRRLEGSFSGIVCDLGKPPLRVDICT